MPNGLSSVLWFCAIVALIPVTLWLLKRTPLGGGAGAGVMKSVAMLPLSTSQRIVTVEIGSGDDRQWLVLGITPSSITTLHSMAPQAIESHAGVSVPGAITTLHTMAPQDVPAAPGAEPPASFAQLFARVRAPGRSGTGDGRAG